MKAYLNIKIFVFFKEVVMEHNIFIFVFLEAENTVVESLDGHILNYVFIR